MMGKEKYEFTHYELYPGLEEKSNQGSRQGKRVISRYPAKTTSQ